MAARSPEVYIWFCISVSQASAVQGCTRLSVAVPWEICALVFSGDSEYVRLLFPGSPLA